MNKYELQMTNRPHVRIVVTNPAQVRDLLAHGWQPVQATVVKADAKGGTK